MQHDTQTLVLPRALEGWRWERRPIQNGQMSRLVSPDGWKTKEYGTYPERAIREAQRYVASYPKPMRPVIEVIVPSEIELMGQPSHDGDVVFSYDILDTETRITVRQLVREITDSLNVIEQAGVRIGDRLIVVRDALPKGTWRSWLRSEFPSISYDTAENLILRAKLERRMPKLSALAEHIAPTAITRLARPSVPEDAVLEVITRAERGEYVPVSAAEEIIAAAKARRKAQGSANGATEPAPIRRQGQEGQEATPHQTIRTGPPPVPFQEAQEAPEEVGTAMMPFIEQIERLFLRGDNRNAVAFLTRTELSAMGQEEPWKSQSIAAIDALKTRWGNEIAAALGGSEEQRSVVKQQAPRTQRVYPNLPDVAHGADWRRPYEVEGSGRWNPIVPFVLIIGDRTSVFAPATIEPCTVIYETASSLRVRGADGSERTVRQDKALCVNGGAAWSEVTRLHGLFADALSDIASHLRDIGSYERRLAEAGGVQKAPNPLTQSVIAYEDPDNERGWLSAAWNVKSPVRVQIDRHTNKKVEPSGTGEMIAQAHHFVCPDDAWIEMQARYERAEAARRELVDLLHSCGTYAEASADGRHTGGVSVTSVREKSESELGFNAMGAKEVHDAMNAALDVLDNLVAGLSDGQLALIAAATWEFDERPWYEEDRERLACHVRSVWQLGLDREVRKGGITVAHQLAMRAGGLK